MAFLTRTRLVQIATGTLANKTLLAPPVVFRTSQVGQVAETVDEAMLVVAAGQRPPASTWWQYVVQWEVQSHAVPALRGMATADAQQRTVVFDVDFWETAADRLAALPPARRNTFVHQFTQRNRDAALQAVRQSVDDYLVRAHFGNFPADQRDPRIATTTDPGSDPLDLLGRLAGFDGDPIDLPARWRGA